MFGVSIDITIVGNHRYYTFCKVYSIYDVTRAYKTERRVTAYMYSQGPMRAEGPKECTAECMLCPYTADRKNSKYYALADITLLHFDVRAFA